MNVGEGLLTTAGATFTVSNDLIEVPCGEAGCAGCCYVHRRATGRQFIEFAAGGSRFAGELVAGTGKWETP